jgi:acetyl esterase
LLYADAMAAAGVATEYICFERQIHGFITMGRVLRESHAAVGVCAEALKRYLK